MNTYARLPVHFASGKGATLYTAEGDAYLDALSGIAVCNLGHAHPEVADALCHQSQRLIHTSNLYEIDQQTALAEQLLEQAQMQKAFFCNSGAEANETAIKLARKYGHDRNIDSPKIIVMENAFHGRTMAALSATGNPKAQAGFGPMLEGFVRVPFDDAEAVAAHAQDPDVVAVLVEPIQGEGGVRLPRNGYLTQLRALCDQNDWLLMVDEIQTGMGRTGQWFAHQHDGIRPDVMTLAKALANGVPIGACLAGDKAADVLELGNHGTTFGGNPLACAAGLAVVKTLRFYDYPKKIAEHGQTLLSAFQSQLADLDGVVEVRGRGYMIGIELDRPCGELVQQALEKHLLINVTQGNTVRLLPPFVLGTEQSQTLIDTVSQLIRDFLSRKA
ncbi:aspartate aminotransferase family protein [Hydrogenovibrio halophilus]|uniref:aspartate aminotransferase family protein n=1 Tax=Hydrogenovibrio halophilus TaxID=373391 RepID=UPI0003691F6A|nr:aspartate aminotransferase family protein [Hydrogenovibrio halophilus]